MRPERIITHLRPMASASLETMSAPANEPAGIEAVMPPDKTEKGRDSMRFVSFASEQLEPY